MKKMTGIRWFLIVLAISLIMDFSLVAAADKVTYIPMIGDSGDEAKRYKIGDGGPGGGIVFYVSSDELHGLEAALPWDQHPSIQWSMNYDKLTGANRGGRGAGLHNTERIVINEGAGDYAAQICANFRGGGYGDWYLPSIEELNLLYLKKDVIGTFYDGYYWSSTEYDNNNAWFQSFSNGSQGYGLKAAALRVRAIRAF